jgi:catechol 2,3-dioxygenase-like lactoylglutathione lyase family enzyme
MSTRLVGSSSRRPSARHPGALELCFLAEEPLDETVLRFRVAGIEIELGPVPRTGATGPIRSVYVRDPDGNLIEIAEGV